MAKIAATKAAEATAAIDASTAALSALELGVGRSLPPGAAPAEGSFALPSLTMPEVSLPEVKLPEVKLPELKLPTMSKPTMPEMPFSTPRSTPLATPPTPDMNTPLVPDEVRPGQTSDNMVTKIKDAGVAGAVSYAAWEVAFWALSIPVCLWTYLQVEGHVPDLTNAEDITLLSAEAFAFISLARLAVPVRLGLAVATVPWVQKNIVDKVFGGGKQ